MKRILFALCAFLFSTSIFAFTQNTTYEIAAKASIDLNLSCPDKFKEGLLISYVSSSWPTNPDFLPAEKLCLNQDPNCTAITHATQYRDLSNQTTDECETARNKGIATMFYIESQDPANWYSFDATCRNSFDYNAELAATENPENFSVMGNCTPTDTYFPTPLEWNNNARTLLIQNTRTYIQTQSQTVTAPIQDTRDQAKKILEAIKKNLADKNITDEEIEITAKTIIAGKTASCIETAEDEEKLYIAWKKFDNPTKKCLMVFLSDKIPTNPYNFPAECSSLGIGAQGNYQAQYYLQSYVDAGFADPTCTSYYVPSVSYGGGAPTTGTIAQNVCNYTPKPLLGCVTKFDKRAATEQTAADDATSYTAFAIVIMVALGFFYIEWRATH